jgi:branched-chain amino acid transport system substrate-binding protein
MRSVMKAWCFGVVLVLTLAVVRGASAQQQPPIRIGVIYSYTGAPPLVGKIFDAGIDLFVKQHGDTIAGRKVEIVKRDDTGLAPDVARRVATELIVQDRVDAIVGMLLTPNTIAVESVSAAAKKPLLIVNSASSHILERDPYAVRLGYTMPQLTLPLATWAAKQKIATAYILYQDYGPGVDAAQAFTKSFTATGGTILGTTAFPVGTHDFSAYVQRIKDAKPQAVYAFINGGGTGPLFIKAAVQAGFRKAGISVLSAGDLINVNELAETGSVDLNLIQAMDYTPSHSTAVNREFRKGAATILPPGLLPDFSMVAAYDAMTAIYRAIEAQNGNVDPDKTMELLRGMKFESPRGPIVIDAKTRDIVENVYVRRVEKRNGKLDLVDLEAYPMVRDPSEN